MSVEGFAECADRVARGRRAGPTLRSRPRWALPGMQTSRQTSQVTLASRWMGPGLTSVEAVRWDGEGDLVFVAEVHERAEGQALGDGELHGAGGDAGGQRPGDLGRLAGVAGVDPVDVPVLLEGEDEADLQGSAGGDGGGEGDELRGEVLGLDGAGAAVAYDLNLRVARSEWPEMAQRSEQQSARSGGECS